MTIERGAMQLSQQSLHEGDLDGALLQLKEKVRKDPANVKERIFLFQLLAIAGQWERSLTQLNVVGELDDAVLPMIQTYREALNCEMLREEVFKGEYSPLVFGEPEQWIAELLEALKLTGKEKYRQSQELREKAFEKAPATSGRIDEQPFEWIADADSRMGPILEAVINGRYYWVPFCKIYEMQVEKPVDLRDSVWMPVNFTWANGGQSVGLVPTRYVGSEFSEDPDIRLARKTAWLKCDAELFIGTGQRMLATDQGEYPFMDVRKISFDIVES